MLPQIKKSKDSHTLDGNQLRAAFSYGIKQLSLNKDLVNCINILPVPNGDTGDNIQKTLLSALSEMNDDQHVGNQAAQCARGALAGAHGSSGIILANFLIGLANALQDRDVASISDIIDAVNKGCVKASIEISDPLPGGICDICGAINQKLSGIPAGNQTLADIITLIYNTVLSALGEEVEKNVLLSKIGINDAGATGFFYFLEGIYRYTMDEPLERDKSEWPSFNVPEDILIKGVLYTVEFLINNVTLPVQEIKKSLSDIGSPVLIAYEGGETVKVLIRTTDPRKVFDRSARFGRSTMIRVDDLIDEQKYFLSKIHTKDVI
ncbi:MAG: DAK2 domain-containing protein [Candidatus Omnitrophota bacterium]